MWDERLLPVVFSLKRQGRQTVLLHQTVAERVGLSPTDSRVLGHLDDANVLTAGELADAVGLTTGAVTKIIDRLEENGFVHRASDPADRRKVLVVVDRDGDAYRHMNSLFQSFGRAVGELLSGYSDEEIEVIRRFSDRASDIMRDETAKLARGEESPRG